MLDQLQQLWPVMTGHSGLVAAIAAWRGFIGVTVPLVNTWLQMKFTELLKASPSIANDIVTRQWYKTTSLILRMVVGVMLPTEASMIVHEAQEKAKGDSKPPFKLPLLFIMGMLPIAFLSGCATLDKTADAVVVRAEQTLHIATASMDTLLKIDDSNRQFYRTNAPAFHNFAEYLRVPITITLYGTNKTEARGLTFVESAQAIKLAYKRNRTPENKASLITALATLETAVRQTQTQLAANLK